MRRTGVEYLTRKEARRRLGNMPERSFARLVAERLPHQGEGPSARYPWPEIFDWYLVRREGIAAARVRADDPRAARLIDVTHQERAARAGLAQMKFEEKRGQLVTKEAYRAELTAVLRELRAAILSMPARSADQVLGLETRPRAVQALQLVGRELLQALQTCMVNSPPLEASHSGAGAPSSFQGMV